MKIQVQELSIHYCDLRALDRVSLDVPERSVTALIGPSGCGKSTFLRALNRMNDIIPGARQEGRVLLDGVDVLAPGADVVRLRKRVGMVFQRSNPFPKSIFENVAYGPRVHGENDRTRLSGTVERCLRRAALWDEVRDRLDASALDLSGGQQQRLCIARALATDPEVLLMDEPASALDPASTARIEELVKELVATYTIVIVTHNMQQAARISQHTAFFYEGRVVEHGATAQVFSEPANAETAAYVTGRFG